MDWLTELRDGKEAEKWLQVLAELRPPPMRLMEVCGTHTVAICRHGLRDLLPETVTLTSGPGCPVCVTATADIDRFIKAGEIDGAIIATFGDLLRVPGSRGSLQEARAEGVDVRPVYSTLDALELARRHPDRQVIFPGIGFETTTPTIAAALLTAEAEKLDNFSVISAHKVMPPALAGLLDDPEIRIDGLICPGHVSIMIGSRAYEPLVQKFRVPCVIAGFEPVDILQAVAMLARQIKEGIPRVEIAYQRAVRPEGNPRALEIMYRVFEPADAPWRGLGVIPGSGLAIREPYQRFDAVKRFGLKVEEAREPAGCGCGAVLRSVLAPADCRLFGTACTPEKPVGPCMVSSEGACGAHYRFSRQQNKK